MSPSNHPLPMWIRAGDVVGEIIVYAIFAGGFFSLGYVEPPIARSIAFVGCALLGAWGLIGFGMNRWDGKKMGHLRLLVLFLVIWLFWTGFQLIPLPTSLTTTLSPVSAEIVTTLEGAGLESPTTLPLAQSPAKGLNSWNQLMASVLFFLGVVTLTTRRSSSARLLVAVIVVCAVEGILGIVSFFGGPGRASGAIFNPNHHAALIALGLPLFLGFTLHLSRFSRGDDDDGGAFGFGASPFIMLYVLLLMLCMSWLLSFSRGSVLAVSAVMFVWAVIEVLGFWLESRREDEASLGGLLRGVGIVLFLFVALGLLMISAAVGSGFRSRGGVNELGGHGRIDHWEATIEGLAQSPLVGLGPSGAEYAINRYSDNLIVWLPVWSHNDPLQWFCEMGGIAGIVSLIVLGWACFRFSRHFADSVRKKSWSALFLRRALLASVLALMVHGLMDFHLRIPLVGFAFLLVLALATSPNTLIGSKSEFFRA